MVERMKSIMDEPWRELPDSWSGKYDLGRVPSNLTETPHYVYHPNIRKGKIYSYWQYRKVFQFRSYFDWSCGHFVGISIHLHCPNYDHRVKTYGIASKLRFYLSDRKEFPEGRFFDFFVAFMVYYRHFSHIRNEVFNNMEGMILLEYFHDIVMGKIPGLSDNPIIKVTKELTEWYEDAICNYLLETPRADDAVYQSVILNEYTPKEYKEVSHEEAFQK